jgi:ferric iron reductase protein FhuF
LNIGMRKAIGARFKARFDAFEPRAALSIWTKWYVNVFLPPILLADVLLGRKLPVALDHIQFIIGDDARVAAFKIRGEAEDTSCADHFDRFEAVVFDHFKPLIEMWSARSDVTCRVLWSNVGNTFEAMLRKVESVSGGSERLEQAQRLLCEPVWRDGRSNPLCGAVYYVAETDVLERRRRVCCLQYLLPDRRFCSACPVEDARSDT